MNGGKVAILVVNGGHEPRWGTWLELCLRKLAEHTRWPDYEVLVWNNRPARKGVARLVAGYPRARLVQRRWWHRVGHPHAGPLQRLYRQAVRRGARYVVAMDSDAHPIRDGWLGQLVGALDERTVLSGVWRDELAEFIPPYVHASCLCTTVAFVRRQRLRFDDRPQERSPVPHDTLCTFTRRAESLGLAVHKLRRTNRRNFHRVLGGIYGDLIYHHGAGSRGPFRYWGEPRSPEVRRRNKQIRNAAGRLLFEDYSAYLSWLLGQPSHLDLAAPLTAAA